MSKLDCLFIHPNTNPSVYGSLAAELAAIEPPYMAALLAGSLRDRGFAVDLFDANALQASPSQCVDRVIESRPRLVVIVVHGQQPSASSQMMDSVCELCLAIKASSDAKILLTGIHPSSLPQRTIAETGADHIGFSDGLDDILSAFGEPRAGEGNLDWKLTSVAWDLLPMTNYRCHNWHGFFGSADSRKHYASLYTGLGCPFQCSFCCINAPFQANRPEGSKPAMRLWSPEWVLNQIDILVQKYGVRHLKFIDEMYCLDRKHVKAIARGIIERGYKLNIWAYARIDTVQDGEMLELMKQSGINWLVLGIESANRAVRAGADKTFSNDSIFANVRRVESAGIDVCGNYMVGMRTDTQETMRETLAMAKQLNTLWFNIYATMAYPGAPDYNWAKERKIPLPGDPGVPGGWTAYSHHSYYTLPLPTDTMTAAEVLRFRDDAFSDYFSNYDYLKLIDRRFGKDAVAHILQMTKTKLTRRILND